MPKLRELAKVIRSKNAGPFRLTFDILFPNNKVYKAVKSSGIVNKKLISRLYHLSLSDIEVIEYDPAFAIKITVVRPILSGAFDDTDIFGAQQHAPLLDIEIPEGSG